MSLNLSSYESLMRDLQSLQHQSRAKYSLSALTMTAPLILTCTLCSILATLYTVSEERMTFVDSQEQVSYYCTKVLYLHVLNGMCTRGVTTGIDVDVSCSQWSDTDTWKAKDETNLVNFNNGTAGYVVTDLASEVKGTWPLLGLLCQIAVALSVVNLIVASLTLDTDLLYTKLKIEDPDLVVLSLSTFMTLCIFGIVGFVAWTVQFNSEVIEASSWTNPACEMTAGASLGAYIFVIGGVFALASLLVSLWALIRLYIIVPWKNRRKAVRDSPRPPKQKQQQVRGDARDDGSRSRREGDIELGGAAGGARLADAAGRPGYHIDTGGGGSVGDDSVVGDMVYDSDDSDEDRSSIGASVRLRGQSKRGGGSGAGGGGGVSIAASVEDSLKAESRRSPEPTPPAKPPRPVKTGRSLASAGAGGGDGNAGSALDADEGTGDGVVDRSREAVPYSPPSFTPEKPPKKPKKTASSSGGGGGGGGDAVWSVSSSVAEVNTAAAAQQQQTPAAASGNDGIGSSNPDTTGSTLAQRTKNKQRKTPVSASVAGGGGGGGGGNNNDQQAEIARLRAALAAAEGAGAVNADIQAEGTAGGIAMGSGGGGGDGKKKGKRSGEKLPPVR